MTTKPQEVYITSAELEKAWDNWLYFHRGLHCEETEERFFTYCHSTEQSFVDDMLLLEDPENKFVCAETAQKVRQCASPHFNTVLAAYYAKHPWK